MNKSSEQDVIIVDLTFTKVTASKPSSLRFVLFLKYTRENQNKSGNYKICKKTKNLRKRERESKS